MYVGTDTLQATIFMRVYRHSCNTTFREEHGKK